MPQTISSNEQLTAPVAPALSLFEYIVAKLIGADQIPPKTVKECNDELKQYSMTRYMKTLYFLCLTSCTIILDNKNKRDQTQTNESTQSLYNLSLFNVFNDITTYPNGPVADGVYRALRDENNTTPGMLFKAGRVLSLNDRKSQQDVSNSIDTIQNAYPYEAKLVKESLERLFGGEYTPLWDRKETGLSGIKYKDIDTQMLIDVSHSFPSWIVATQDIEEELYAQKGVKPVFDFIDNKGIRGNISALLQDEDYLRAELKTFERFRRNRQEVR